MFATKATSPQVSKAKREFTAGLFAWLHQVKADPEVPASAFKVAFEVSSHWFWDNRVAFRSCQTIADAIAMSEKTVIRALHLLHDRGHLSVDWGQQGSGHSNRYSMVLKPAPVQVSEAEKPASVTRKNLHPCPENLHQCRRTFPLIILGKLKLPPRMEREQTSLRSSDGPPAGAGAPLTGRAPAEPLEARKQEAAAEEREEKNRADGAARRYLIVPYAFAQLRATWVRPWPDHDDAEARAAYTDACQEVTPAVILSAAAQWVANADAPRFLPKLSDWLIDRCWERDPPHKKRGRGNGTNTGAANSNQRQRGPQSRKSHNISLAEAMMAAE